MEKEKSKGLETLRYGTTVNRLLQMATNYMT